MSGTQNEGSRRELEELSEMFNLSQRARDLLRILVEIAESEGRQDGAARQILAFAQSNRALFAAMLAAETPPGESVPAMAVLHLYLALVDRVGWRRRPFGRLAPFVQRPELAIGFLIKD